MQRTIDEAATVAGRPTDSVRRMYNVGGIITGDNAARSDSRQEGLVAGSPEHWANTLAQYYGELGMDAFSFAPVGGNTLDQIRLFAEEVVPRARKVIGARRPGRAISA